MASEASKIPYCTFSGGYAKPPIFIGAATQSVWQRTLSQPTPPNQPPIADPDGPYTFVEASSSQLDGSGSSDPDQDNTTLTYEWDLNYNGVSFDVDTIGIQPAVTFPDNFSARTIALRVTDSGELMALATTSLEVTNVEPTASFVNTSGTLIQGESATLAFSNQLDPSTVDTAVGFRYSYDCTDDGTFEASDITPPFFDCPYATSGNFTARGQIKDKDGGFTPYTVGVTVLTPQQATESIMEDVQALVTAGTLSQKQGKTLIKELEKAIKDLDKDKTAAAILDLQDFINQVNALINQGVLTSAQGQPLIDAANKLIHHLQGQASDASNEAVELDHDIFLSVIQRE